MRGMRVPDCFAYDFTTRHGAIRVPPAPKEGDGSRPAEWSRDCTVKAAGRGN
jgi:hypothetical protein